MKLEATEQATSHEELNRKLTTVQTILAESVSEREELRKQNEKLSSSTSQLNQTIQQLKVVARKYRSQYDELKQSYDQLDELHKRCTQENNSSSTSALSMLKKDEQLKNLQAELERVQSECETFQNQIEQLEQENRKVSSQLGESESKSKRIALQAREKISTLQKALSALNSSTSSSATTSASASTPITSNVSLPSSPSTSQPQQTSSGQSRKQPQSVSSSAVIVSRPSEQSATTSQNSISASRIGSSCSNVVGSADTSAVVVSATLQSAHITSHSTSSEENSVESNQIPDSNDVSSNKRGFSNLTEDDDDEDDGYREDDEEYRDVQLHSAIKKSRIQMGDSFSTVGVIDNSSEVECDQATTPQSMAVDLDEGDEAEVAQPQHSFDNEAYDPPDDELDGDQLTSRKEQHQEPSVIEIDDDESVQDALQSQNSGNDQTLRKLSC